MSVKFFVSVRVQPGTWLDLRLHDFWEPASFFAPLYSVIKSLSFFRLSDSEN